MDEHPNDPTGLLGILYRAAMTPLPPEMLPKLDIEALMKYLKEKQNSLPEVKIPELPTKPQWMKDMETPQE